MGVDFEAFGGRPAVNGFCKLGAAIMDMDTGKPLGWFRIAAKQDGYVKDQRCMDEFWSKHPALYEKISKECEESKYTCEEAVEEFWKWLDSMMLEGDNPRFIGDNVPFDYSLLACFSKSRDILYAFGTYRDIIDVGTYYCAAAGFSMNNTLETDKLSSKECIRNLLGKDIPTFPVPHDHEPDHDALNILYRWHWFHEEWLKDETKKGDSV